MAQLEQRHARGWDILRLSSDAVAVEIVPGLGGTITSLTRQADAAGLLWSPPWGLRPSGSQSLPGNSEAQMIDSLAGGWQTLFPNGGDSVFVHGVEWAYDGEARLTWMDWEFTGSSVRMTGRLVRSPFEITKIISVRDYEITVGETVRNVGRERIETMWGSQLMLGGVLVGQETTVDAAAAVVRPDPQTSPDISYDDLMPWPRSHGPGAMINLGLLPGPDSGETRLAYLSDFSRPMISISRPSHHIAIELDWDVEVFPYVWYSMEAGGRSGFPWYRTGYFLSLTPCTSWPAHGLHDARRISDSTILLDPREVLTSYVALRVQPVT
ncbi:MAG: hypothetical protein ACJ72M_16505 [Propionibacteriaceae bacterium]|jgi:hypothetical protein